MKCPFIILFLFAVEALHSQHLGHGYEFENNGKTDRTKLFSSVYELSTPPQFKLSVDSLLKNALRLNEVYLSRKSVSTQVGNLTISNSELEEVNDTLMNPSDSIDFSIFDFYQINGEDNQGNVHFTGYFIPVIQVRSTPDSIFKFPLYEQPSVPYSRMPNRQQIDFGKVLENQNLELAYSSNLLDNYFMQVQGSGMVRYPDGQTELLSYGGTNGKKYTSIGKHLVSSGQVDASEISLESIRSYFQNFPDSLEFILGRNKSYTFFSRNGEEPVGAANVPLTPGHSIAVDPDFIPHGSILLAKIPKLDDSGLLTGHQFQILIAQDIGGAIKGSGHVDVYFGIGKEAEKKASALHHYGELWLILPKKN